MSMLQKASSLSRVQAVPPTTRHGRGFSAAASRTGVSVTELMSYLQQER